MSMSYKVNEPCNNASLCTLNQMRQESARQCSPGMGHGLAGPSQSVAWATWWPRHDQTQSFAIFCQGHPGWQTAIPSSHLVHVPLSTADGCVVAFCSVHMPGCATTRKRFSLCAGLYGEQVPQTVETFKKAVAEGTYNGTVFFKVISARSLLHRSSLLPQRCSTAVSLFGSNS